VPHVAVSPWPCTYFFCIIVALRDLVKETKSDDVREKAQGALWSFEDKDKQRKGKTEHSFSLFILFLIISGK